MPAKISLLIVEDDQELLDTLTRWFIRRGYDVTPVRHPRHALSAAAVRSYHAAVLDMTLPEENGLELMSRLQARLADLQVVILSGVADPEREREAVERGAVEYLLKPCSLVRLEGVIQRAIENAPAAVALL
jgi:DNA-binding NtrC family response regulator